MPGLSATHTLKIIKGLPKVPGFANSAEIGVDELDFTDVNGFAVDFYDIQIPNIKSSAVYADSPISDGRTLISGVLGNLTETIRLSLNAGSLVQMAAMLSRLAKFRRDCLDYWQTYGQIEPVYLKHQIAGEPGPRYALLYNIEINVETPNEPDETHRIVTLTVEREPAWRGLAPGDNPKRWTVEHAAGQAWNSASADLVSGINHFAYTTTLFNCIEFLNRTTIDRKNYIDIDATNIPGSAPALVEIDLDRNASTVFGNFYIARSTKPTSLTNRDGNSILQFNTLAAVTATALGTDTSLVDDTGAIAYPPTKVARQRATCTFATQPTMKARLTWTTNTAVETKPRLSTHVWRGRYMVFVRCRQTGAADNEIQLEAFDGSLLDVPVQAGTGNTTEWPVVYLGTGTLANTRSIIGHDGRGAYVNDGTSDHYDFIFEVYAARNSGSGNLYISDVIFIPIDECCIKVDAISANSITYDNTGYFQHGTTDHMLAARTTNLSSSPYDAPAPQLVAGQPITLLPGIANRLYFIDLGGTSVTSITQASYTARMNIIPRWYGYRDS